VTSEPVPDAGTGDLAAPVQRLRTIGLPPRAAGWVPEQPANVGLPDVPAAIPEAAARQVAPQPDSHRLDALRDGAVARLPEWAAIRIERMSGPGFASAIAALVVLLVAVGIGIHHHRSQSTFSSYSAPADDSPASDAPAAAGDDGSSIVIDVAGKVRHPGLVTLPLGARVADAVKAAGGALRHRDLARVDLAQRVTDGELLTIGRRRGRGATGGGHQLVDLSTASLTKLETLPGVGPVTAQKIVTWRSAHGGFTSVSELQQVSGIGPARYAELSPLVAP
jgi:competence protein ComEA